MNPIGGLTPQDRDDYVALAEDRDPSTETWPDPSTPEWRAMQFGDADNSPSAQLRETQRRLDERCTKLAEVMGALAASQQDLTRAKGEVIRVRAQRDELGAQLDAALAAQQGEPCAFRELAVTAMQERDLARAQLDDAIATFRADKET